MKLFIWEKLCLRPSRGIVLMLAFFKDVIFLEIMFYPLPDSRTVVISLSSPFTISEKFENKKGN